METSSGIGPFGSPIIVKPGTKIPAPEPSEGIGELIERLMIANMKLWAVCDKKANAANMTQEDLRVLVADDLNLCKSRAAIRAEINRRLGQPVSSETVKHYGESS